MQRSGKNEDLRERVAVLPDEIRRQGADPFAVDISSILSELRKDFEKLKGEEMVKDAVAVNSVSKIVYLQEKWLADRLKGMGIGIERVRERLLAMDMQILASCLLQSQHLPLSVRHLSTRRLSSAADYWVSLIGWGRYSKIGPFQVNEEEGLESLQLGIDDLEKEMQAVKEELFSSLSSSPIPYDKFLEGKEGKDKVRMAYIISILCSRGEVSIRFDPSLSKYILLKGEGVPDSSVAIVL